MQNSTRGNVEFAIEKASEVARIAFELNDVPRFQNVPCSDAFALVGEILSAAGLPGTEVVGVISDRGEYDPDSIRGIVEELRPKPKNTKLGDFSDGDVCFVVSEVSEDTGCDLVGMRVQVTDCLPDRNEPGIVCRLLETAKQIAIRHGSGTTPGEVGEIASWYEGASFGFEDEGLYATFQAEEIRVEEDFEICEECDELVSEENSYVTSDGAVFCKSCGV